MNIDQNKYEKIDEEPETPVFEALEMKPDYQGVDITPAPPSATEESRERTLSLIVIGLVSLLTGVDYVIIIPTAWGYVNTFVSEQYAGIAVGVLLSVYALSGAISGIFLGYFYDNGVSLKRLLLFGCVFQIVGNTFYFVGIDIYIVVLSRFIAGIGMGLVPPLLAEISRRSTPEKRTQLLAKILGTRQFGLFLGPALTAILEHLHFTIFGLPVTVYNAPGLVMALLWAIAGITTACLFHDLPAAIPVPATVSNIIRASSSKEACGRIGYICQQPVLVVLLITTFIAYFNQTALETALTPFTSYEFNWNAFDVSVLFAFAAVEIALAYVLIHFISKIFRDQTILLFGYIVLSTACLMGVILLPFTVPGSDQYLPGFLVFVLLDIFALPLIVVTTTSLFSQEIKNEQQGIGQGIQRAVVNTAAVVGPLYAGSLVERIWVMLLPMFIVVLIATILVAIFYRSFRSKKDAELSPLIPPVDNKES